MASKQRGFGDIGKEKKEKEPLPLFQIERIDKNHA